MHGPFPPSACASFMYDNLICFLSSMMLELSKAIQRLIYKHNPSHIQHACN